MSIDGYWAIIKSLGLTATRIPNVFVAADGEKYNVPDPARMPEAVRMKTIRRLKTLLGVD